MRSAAAAPGLFGGQEGHAGAEDVTGEDAAVRAGGRLGSFGDGQKSSIAENIAGKKHNAWSG